MLECTTREEVENMLASAATTTSVFAEDTLVSLPAPVQRPMAIHRSVRQPSEELPEPLEQRPYRKHLRPAIARGNQRASMTLTSAWSTGGFIEDLDALGTLTHEETTTFSGREYTTKSEYKLCGNAQHYRNDESYRFEYPRDEEIKKGCLATFTVTYRGEPGSTLIGFSLVDYELGRMHMEELDRQSVEALTGEDVEASDMDL
ncbi:MAG: hypothetical protein ABJO27_19915 [Pseudoruegeria sp.]